MKYTLLERRIFDTEDKRIITELKSKIIALGNPNSIFDVINDYLTVWYKKYIKGCKGGK